MQKRSILLNGMALLGAVVAVLFIAAEPHEHLPGDPKEIVIPREEWSFNGFFGKFEQAQVKRGFQVYHDVCSACHSMNLMAYRNLTQIGFTEDEVMLSNMIREGHLTREQASERAAEYAKPRMLSIREYAQLAGFNCEEALNVINAAPKLY